jgi:uncharacterized membrane protein
MRRSLAAGLLAILAGGCAVAPVPEPAGKGAATEISTDPAIDDATATFEPRTAVYRCATEQGEITLVTRTRENGLHVFLPPELNQVYLNCEHDRRASIWEHAKLSGVDFRAVGNEPGWVLEIREGSRLDLSYDYGQARIAATISDMQTDPESRSTRYIGFEGERRVEVRLVGERCSDTMVDETYPTQVEIRFDDRRLTGCGRPLH